MEHFISLLWLRNFWLRNFASGSSTHIYRRKQPLAIRKTLGAPTVRVLAGYESPEGVLDAEQARGYWFDDQGVLVKTFFDGIETHRSEFAAFGSVKVAHLVSVLKNGKVAMLIRITEVSPGAPTAAKNFEIKGHDWKRAFTSEVR